MKIINMFSNKEKWITINELIITLKSKMKLMEDEINQLILALDLRPHSVNESMIIVYIETRSSLETAKYMRLKGIRSSRGTSFSPGDVTELIQSDLKDVDEVLLKFARELYGVNYKSVSQRYF